MYYKVTVNNGDYIDFLINAVDYTELNAELNRYLHGDYTIDKLIVLDKVRYLPGAHINSGDSCWLYYIKPMKSYSVGNVNPGDFNELMDGLTEPGAKIIAYSVIALGSFTSI